MKITISNSILSQLPLFNIIALSMDVVSEENNSEVENLIIKTEKHISEEYSLEDVLNIPLIK